MSDGKEERDDAIARADVNADPDWKEVALKAVRWLATESAEFTTDDVWWALNTYYPNLGTHEPRALGAVMRRASRDGFIEPTNRVKESERAVCHRNPKKVWRSLVFRSDAA